MATNCVSDALLFNWVRTYLSTPAPSPRFPAANKGWTEELPPHSPPRIPRSLAVAGKGPGAGRRPLSDDCVSHDLLVVITKEGSEGGRRLTLNPRLARSIAIAGAAAGGAQAAAAVLIPFMAGEPVAWAVRAP
jgi:hypothetical protein